MKIYLLKLKDAYLLLKSNVYVLITNTQTSMFGKFDGMGSSMKINAMKEARNELTKQIKLEVEANKKTKK